VFLALFKRALAALRVSFKLFSSASLSANFF
jgi:hypothetical protein